MAWIKVDNTKLIDAEKVYSIYWKDQSSSQDKSLYHKKILGFYASINVGGENSPVGFEIYSYDFTSEYLSWIQSFIQNDITKTESELNNLTLEYEKCKKEKPNEFPDIRYEYPKKSEGLKYEIEKRKKLLDLPKLLEERTTIKDNSTRYHTQKISDILSIINYDFGKELNKQIEEFANPITISILNHISEAKSNKQSTTLDFYSILKK